MTGRSACGQSSPDHQAWILPGSGSSGPVAARDRAVQLSTSSPTAGIGTRIQQRAAGLDDTTIPLPERNEAPRAAELPE